MDRTTELRDFLTSRRARLRPEDVGLTDYGDRRRVPGLRREELAQLAGVSVTHYTRLEQGQVRNISTDVLDAVATALRLNAYEREYLGNLVRPPAPSPAPDTEVRPDLQRLMASIPDVPAHVSGRYGDLLAWNPMTALLIFDPVTFEPPRRTWPHIIFLHEPFRRLLDGADWERLARQDVAYLRLCWSRNPGDPVLGELLAELETQSEEFRRIWAEHEVADWSSAIYTFRHPEVGPIELSIELMQSSGDREQWFVTYAVEPDSSSQAALRRLRATPHPTPTNVTHVQPS